MSEEELAKYFIDYFDGLDVYQEVPNYGTVCDIMVKDGNIITAVEVKNSLNFDVVEQAVNNKRYAHYSYIAVPVRKGGRHFQKEICKMLGIGILAFNPKVKSQPVTVMLKAKLNRKIYPPKLKDWQKLNTAGSKSVRITAFSYFVSSMKDAISKNEGITAKDLYTKLDKHYKTFSSFKSSILSYIRSGVVKGLLFEDGKFYTAK